MEQIISKLSELSRLAFESVKPYVKQRFFLSVLQQELKSKTIVILAGPRGVGKTIILKQLLQNRNDSFYLSVDQLDPDQSLFELAKTLESKYKIKNLILDEIHYNHNYAVDLKSIYDFLKIKAFVTSSIALKLEELSVDLSRRAHFFQLYPFSFREYIYFEKNIEIEPLTLKKVLDRKWNAEHVKYGHLFHEYIKGRLYPFTLEEQNHESLFRNIFEKVIRVDIPQIGKLNTYEVLQIEKMMAFIGRAESEGISISSLSKNLAITKYKVEEYLKLLSQAYLLQILYPKGTSVTREPKVLVSLPYRLLFKDFADVIGGLREDYVVETLRSQGLVTINYLKSTRGEKTPDFYIEDSRGKEMVIEVGGKGKGRSQFKGIDIEQKYVFVDSLSWNENQFPLFLLGMY
jgi:predicted AAA+ superfamily ATPase